MIVVATIALLMSQRSTPIAAREARPASTSMPEWGDPFVAEWRAFHHCVTTREQPRASAADFREDLDLFAESVRSM